MSRNTELLKIDVERAIGFKINSTTQAKVLHQLILEKTNSSISLSTIRRLWKLIPSRKPTQKTLDELAKFINFNSFMDYNKHKNKNPVWFDLLVLNDLKFKEALTNEDMELLNSYFLAYQSLIFHLNIIERAILTKNWQIIFDIFDPSKNALIEQEKENFEFSAKIANLIFKYLYHLPRIEFEETIRILCQNTNFKNQCVYKYIDLQRLNSQYGAILKEIKNFPINKEEQLFLSLIEGLNRYLNHNSLPEIIFFDPTKTRNVPSVLLGRYYGYQVLYFSNKQKNKKEEQVWMKYLLTISNSDEKRDLLHEFVVHMILGRKMSKLGFLLEKYHDEIFDQTSFLQHLDQFIFNLIDVIVSFNQKDVKRAVRVFSNLSITEFFENSYCDYYLIFYYLIGSNLPFSQNITNSFQIHYRELAKNADFKLFSEEYRKSYFITSNHN